MLIFTSFCFSAAGDESSNFFSKANVRSWPLAALHFYNFCPI
jgi:hypothetical protein